MGSCMRRGGEWTVLAVTAALVAAALVFLSAHFAARQAFASEFTPVPTDHVAIYVALTTDAPTSAVQHLTQRIIDSKDAQGKAFVVIDKRRATLHVFNVDGRSLGESPILLGSAVGDHTVPGVGSKAIANVLPDERTTPAGRFEAESGRNARGEDVIWVDYDAGVSMHRVIQGVPSEARLARLASPTHEDNRISYGCINVPPAFFDKVLTPAFARWGAIIYILPELANPDEYLRIDINAAAPAQSASASSRPFVTD